MSHDYVKFDGHKHCGSENIMVLVYHVIWIESPLIISHYLPKFSGHRHWDSEDIMFLVFEEQCSTYSRLNPLLLFISKAHVISRLHT